MEKSEMNPQMRRRATYAMFVSQMEAPEELKGFVLILYGYQDVLSMKPFLAKLQSSECSWIFSAPEIKRRMHFYLNEEVLMQLGL